VSELRVYLRHQRAAQICVPGSRRWFESRGLDWKDYCRNGISADVLRKLDDPISNRALAAAEAEQEASNGRR
jgi:hypothetical protein